MTTNTSEIFMSQETNGQGLTNKEGTGYEFLENETTAQDVMVIYESYLENNELIDDHDVGASNCKLVNGGTVSLFVHNKKSGTRKSGAEAVGATTKTNACKTSPKDIHLVGVFKEKQVRRRKGIFLEKVQTLLRKNSRSDVGTETSSIEKRISNGRRKKKIQSKNRGYKLGHLAKPNKYSFHHNKFSSNLNHIGSNKCQLPKPNTDKKINKLESDVHIIEACIQNQNTMNEDNFETISLSGDSDESTQTNGDLLEVLDLSEDDIEQNQSFLDSTSLSDNSRPGTWGVLEVHRNSEKNMRTENSLSVQENYDSEESGCCQDQSHDQVKPWNPIQHCEGDGSNQSNPFNLERPLFQNRDFDQRTEPSNSALCEPCTNEFQRQEKELSSRIIQTPVNDNVSPLSPRIILDNNLTICGNENRIEERTNNNDRTRNRRRNRGRGRSHSRGRGRSHSRGRGRSHSRGRDRSHNRSHDQRRDRSRNRSHHRNQNQTLKQTCDAANQTTNNTSQQLLQNQDIDERSQPRNLSSLEHQSQQTERPEASLNHTIRTDTSTIVIRVDTAKNLTNEYQPNYGNYILKRKIRRGLIRNRRYDKICNYRIDRSRNRGYCQHRNSIRDKRHNRSRNRSQNQSCDQVFNRNRSQIRNRECDETMQPRNHYLQRNTLNGESEQDVQSSNLEYEHQ